MWQTVLAYKYEDQPLSDIKAQKLVGWTELLKHNLKPKGYCFSRAAVLIPGTEDQCSADIWHANRYPRMTASIAKESVCLWNVVSGSRPPTASVLSRCQAFLRKNVWGLDKVTTHYMQRGIELEGVARASYLDMRPHVNVEKTGLWVHYDMPQLACSPDGIVFDNGSYGIIEIKVLKLLQNHSVCEVAEKMSNKELQSSCFRIDGDKLILKKAHAYYYQVQFQLGVTGLDWCDFILFSSKGPPSVERIFPDNIFINNILEANIKLWQSIVAPEVFEQRTPRYLAPFIIEY